MQNLQISQSDSKANQNPTLPAHIFPDVLVETDRLRFRKCEPSDLDLITQVLADPRMMKDLGGPLPESSMPTRLDGWIHKWNTGYALVGAVVNRETLEKIGTAGLHPSMIPDEAGFEISYMIRPEFGSRGFATEISKVLVQFAFQNLNLPRLLINTHPANEISNKIAARLGFTCLGERDFAHQSLAGFNQHVIWALERPIASSVL